MSCRLCSHPVLCVVAWAAFATVSFAAVSAGIIYVHEKEDRTADRSPVIDYGPADDTYMKQKFIDDRPLEPPVLMPAHEAFVCIDGAKWLRACPSTLEWWLLKLPENTNGTPLRLDFDDKITRRPLHHDSMIGPLPPKCRTWMVPELAPGRYVQAGIVKSYCPHIDKREPITTPFPRIPFVVKATQ